MSMKGGFAKLGSINDNIIIEMQSRWSTTTLSQESTSNIVQIDVCLDYIIANSL